MPVIIGQQLGLYEITALLGKGGMGEVYRARDTKLKRDVAIKFLPDEFLRDVDRTRRFQREAEVLASLNHPNIAAIYDLQEANGNRFLILELVGGETLAERIARGPIPLDEALDIARQICEALEAAHERGIVHRDLKPANVKVSPEGKVKVLDFGLAKVLESAPAQVSSNSPTMLSAAATNGGVILGTAGYMSPEQARGQAADQRSDIFSFGCVLYEMLTGRQTFSGETVSDVLASILAREPDLRALPHDLHPRTDELIRRCLAKKRADRWHAIADVRLEIVAIATDPHGLKLRSSSGDEPRSLWRRALPTVMAVVLAVALTAAAFRYMQPVSSIAVMQFSYVLPEDQRFTNTGRHLLAISPDGSSIVYVANSQLYVRKMSELEARPIPGTALGRAVTSPFFAPDGQSVGFFSDGKIKKIAITGGLPVDVCDATNPFGATWGPNDQIYIGQGPKGILRVSANGGSKPETVVTVKSGETAHGPQVLPDGDLLLFTLASSDDPNPWDKAQIVVQSLKSGGRHLLISGGSDARYVPSGHIVYAIGSRLVAVPFDASKIAVTGGATPIVQDVLRPPTHITGAAHFSSSTNGYLVYIPAIGDFDNRSLALMDRAGVLKPFEIAAGPYNHPRISPDGKRVAVQREDASGSDIWIYDVTGSTSPRRLTFSGRNSRPIWTRSGDRIVYASQRDGSSGLYSQAVEAPGVAELLTASEKASIGLQPESWTSDGKLVFITDPGGASTRPWMLPLTPGQKPTPLIPGYATNSSFSPDGRWFLYTFLHAGQQDVYAQPFPITGAMYQISTAGGHYPVWSPGGKQIFYSTNEAGGTSQLMAVDVQTQPTFVVGKTTPLPIKGIVSNQERGGFDITPDGKYFVVLLPKSRDASKPPPEQINITLNWFEELKQRVPAR